VKSGNEQASQTAQEGQGLDGQAAQAVKISLKFVFFLYSHHQFIYSFFYLV
jgi:hypothetical protein